MRLWVAFFIAISIVSIFHSFMWMYINLKAVEHKPSLFDSKIFATTNVVNDDFDDENEQKRNLKEDPSDLLSSSSSSQVVVEQHKEHLPLINKEELKEFSVYDEERIEFKELIRLESQWFHSNYSDSSQCIKRHLRPRNAEELAEVEAAARKMIRKPFDEGYIVTLKERIRKRKGIRTLDKEWMDTYLSIAIVNKDFLTETKKHMKVYAERFPRLALIYVVPLKHVPQRERKDLISTAWKYPNVLLAEWPCSPFDRHHAQKSYASYFIPKEIEFVIQMNNDMYFLHDPKETTEQKIISAIYAMTNSKDSVIHMITDEFFVNSANKTVEDDSVLHTLVYGPPNINTYVSSHIPPEQRASAKPKYFLVYPFIDEKEKNNNILPDDGIDRSPFIEDHATLLHRSLSRVLYDPATSDDKEMFSLGFISSFASTPINAQKLQFPLQYTGVKDHLVLNVVTGRISAPKDKWQWPHLLLRRLDFLNNAISITNFHSKFGLYIFANQYAMLFGEKLMHGSKISFVDENLELGPNELSKLKIAYGICFLGTVGFTHYRIGDDSYEAEDIDSLPKLAISSILGDLYEVGTSSTKYSTLLRAEWIPEPDPYRSDQVALAENLESTKKWSDKILKSLNIIRQENASRNIGNFLYGGFRSFAPLFVEPTSDHPTLLWLSVKIIPETQVIRDWLKSGVASLIIKEKTSEYQDFLIHFRWYSIFSNQAKYFDSEKDEMKRTCFVDNDDVPNNIYTTRSILHRTWFPKSNYIRFNKLIKLCEKHGFIRHIPLPYFANSQTKTGHVREIIFEDIQLYQYAPCHPGILSSINKYLQLLIPDNIQIK